MKAYLMLFFILFPAIYIDSPAQGSSYSMGQLSSVYSDRALDALRNPALLSRLENPDQFGFFFSGMIFQESDIEAYYDAPVSTYETVFPDLTSSLQLGILTAVTSQAGRGVFGIGISTSDIDQIDITKTRNNALAYDAVNGLFAYCNRSVTETYSPALVISYSMSTTSRSSLGFQISSGYTLMRMEDNEKNGNELNGIENSSKRRLSRTTISTELTLGYTFCHGLYDIGFLIKSGKLTFQQDHFEEVRRDFKSPSPLDWNITYNETRSFYPLYTGGVAFALGTHVKPLRFFGVAVETVLTAPVAYRFTELSASMDIPYYVENKRTRFFKDLTCEFKTGVDFTIARYFIISAGYSYTHEEITISYRGFKTESENTSHAGTLGFDYRPSGNTALFIGVRLLSLVSEEEENIRLVNQFRIKTSLETISLYANAGASIGFD